MNEVSDEAVLEQWNELKDLFTNLELDAVKSARGVVAAGVRFRKGLRLLKSKMTDLVRVSLALEKQYKAK